MADTYIFAPSGRAITGGSADVETILALHEFVGSGTITVGGDAPTERSVPDLPRTIYRKGVEPSDTEYWLIWHDEVEVNKTPVIEDTYDRIYWSGDALPYPKYKPWSEIQAEWGTADGLGNTVYCDGDGWRLGVPPPAAPPVVTGGSSAPTDTVDREYVVTWFSPNGGESCASDVISVTANVGYGVTLSDLPTDYPEGVTYLYVYRRDGSVGEYKYVGRIDAGQDVFFDNVETGALGSALTPALLTCSLGSYPAPTVALTNPGAQQGETTTYYYSWAIYQKIQSLDFFQGEVGPGLCGWISWSDPLTLPSLATDDTQEVVVTIPRNANGSYQTSLDYYLDLPPSFNVSNVDDCEIVVLRSTTWSPSNQDRAGFEVVARSAPKLATDLSAHELTVPARGTYTGYNPSVLEFGVLVDSRNYYYTPPSIEEGTSFAVGEFGRLYTLTYILPGPEESLRSYDSNLVRVNDGDEVTVSLPAAPGTATSVNIYRRTNSFVSGSTTEIQGASADYKLVATIPAFSSTYNDIRLDSELGVSIPAASLVVEYEGPDTTAASSVAEAEAPADLIPETRLYVYTYVTEYGEEGPPSDTSELIEAFPGAAVTITALLINPNTEQYNIQSKRIYRSSTGTNLTTLQFVAEIPIDQTSYNDSLPSTELGEVIPSTYYYPPPATCRGMRLMANGIMVMFDGKTIYPSEAYLPHAYDPNNFLTTDYEIIGLGVFGQSLAVITTGFPYVLTGVNPSSMSLTRLPVPQAGSSKRSIISTGDGVLYSSPDGKMIISASGVKNLTEMLLNRDQWQAYNPRTMHTYVYNNYAFVFHDTGCIMFNFSGGAAIMSELDITALSGYYDPIQDALFYGKEDGIWKWNVGDYVPYTWRSKIFQVLRPHNFGWAQVEADEYPLTFRVYNGNSTNPLYSVEVQSREPFRLPAGSVHRDWYVQLEGTSTIFQVQIADAQEEIQQV